MDLDAYFARIGVERPRAPTLDALNALVLAHVQTIPFENLDVLLGRRIGLDDDALAEKLVHARRGGYCFEQNGLFLRVLEELGFEARPVSARVRYQRPRDFVPPRTHLFVRVEIEGESWLADVGVGGTSPTAAMRLATDAAQPTPHEAHRVVREGPLYFHQVRFGDAWHDVKEFTLEEMPRIDREVANWFTSTHPQSHFKNRLMVARAAPNGVRLTVLNGEFTVRDAHGRPDTRALGSSAELLAVLDEHFGLRFAPGTRFGAPGSPWPV